MRASTVLQRLRHGAAPHGPLAETGSAFVELSLVVMSFFVLLVGTVELTLLLLDYNALTKSVRNAASFWSTQALNPATAALRSTSTPLLDAAYQGQALAAVVANLVHCRDTTCAVTVEVQPTVTAAYCRDHDGLSYVTVQVTYPHRFLLWPDHLRAALGDSITLGASSLMRIPSLAGDYRLAPACVW